MEETAPYKQFIYARHGFNLLAIYWVVRIFLKPDGVNFLNILASSIFILSIVLLTIQVHIGIKREHGIKLLDALSKLLLYTLLIICVITILRGVTFDLKRLLTLVANPIVGGTVWLLPLFVLIGIQRGFFFALLPTFYLHAIVGGVFSVASLLFYLRGDFVTAITSASVAQMLTYAVYFMLLTGAVKQQRYRLVLYLSLLLVTACHLLLENRTHFAIGSVVILSSIVLGRARSQKAISTRVYLAAVLFIPILVILLNMFSLKLTDEWLIDSRTFLFDEMAADFSVMDYIIGRGALGTYYSEYFYWLQYSGIEGGDAAIRQTIESGYLNIILKAGLVGLFAVVGLKLTAVFMAYKLPTARVSLGVAIFLSIQLIAMILSYNLSFEPFQVFTWVVVGYALAAIQYQTVVSPE